MTETCLPTELAERSEPSQALGSEVPIFEIDPLRDPRWNTFINAHADACVFHTRQWIQALKSCYGYEPGALSSSAPGEPLSDALLFCKIRSPLTGARIVSLPFSDHCEPLVGDAGRFEWLLRALTERVDQRAWKYIEVRPTRFVPPTGAFGISQSYYLHRLDLQPSEQALFRSFHKDCVQRKIRRAERESLRYEEGSSEALLQHFYRLLIMTRRRQGAPPQPLDWFRSLISCLGPSLKIRLARKADAPVASILTISHNRTMVYKYGCSDPSFNNLGGTALLFWRTIQEAKASGIEEFDLGRSDMDNAGLIAFKEHWGSQRKVVNYWRYPARAAGFGIEHAAKYLKKAVCVAPDASLVLIGRLLYRHIG